MTEPNPQTQGNITDRTVAREKQEAKETRDNWQSYRQSQRQDTERGGGR